MHLHVNTLRSQPPLVQLAILVVTLVPLYLLSYQYRIRHTYGTGATSNHKTKNLYPSSSPAFEQKWLQTHIVSPFNPAALRRYCNHTITWHPNLAFHLPDANGGIGNIKGNFVDFLFYAIEAGASTLVLPSMATRDDEDLMNVWAGRQPFRDFFDEVHFRESLREACPQMKVVPEKEGMEGLIKEGYFYPRGRRLDMNPDDTREHYVRELEEWVKATTGKAIDEHEREQKKVVVSVERTLWQFDTFVLPWNVRREVGQMFRIRADVRELAAEVVKNLGLEFGLNIDASEPVPTTLHGFFGAHLRTEDDAARADFLHAGSTDVDTQARALIDQAVKHRLSTLYVANGSPTEIARFRHTCATNRPPLNVTSKFDLLSASSASALRKMSWDQQALVDFEVLQRCTFFGGMTVSSFSHQIAMTRNQWLLDQGKVADPYAVRDMEENVDFDDGFSRITGTNRDGPFGLIRRGMWP